MSDYKLVDSTELDSDLSDIADAIRTKGGTSAPLLFPDEFISAIAAISTGGDGYVKTGTLTLETATKNISVSGIDFTPTHFIIMTDNANIPTDNSWHTYAYIYPAIGSAGAQVNRYGSSNWNASARAANYCSFSNGTISLSANYNFVAEITYYWAAW